jgi:hypothetical protein
MRFSQLPASVQQRLREQHPELAQPREHKYRVSSNKAARTADGILFDSKWECAVYEMLKALVGRSRIELQKPMVLQEGYHAEDGHKVRDIKLIVDFCVDGQVYIDAKGVQTAVSRMKRKMFELRYGCTLHLVHKKFYRSGHDLRQNLKEIIEGEQKRN